LKRTIHRELTQPLATMVARGQIEPGAQVTVSLNDDQQHLVIRAGEIKPVAPAPQPKILIVDDNRDLLLFLASQLTEEGWLVLAAETAQQARQLFLDRNPGTVLVDCMLGEDDGFRLGLGFRTEQPGAQIIIMTGGGLTHDELMICAERSVPVLYKPFLADEVLNLIKGRYRRASSAAAGSSQQSG
jgi:DNA-binding response OmpR family regulator